MENTSDTLQFLELMTSSYDCGGESQTSFCDNTVLGRAEHSSLHSNSDHMTQVVTEERLQVERNRLEAGTLVEVPWGDKAVGVPLGEMAGVP